MQGFKIKNLTKKQKAKADRIIKLIGDLNAEGVVFYMNSMPDNQIGFLRGGANLDSYEEFFDFLNHEDLGEYYSPSSVGNLFLEGYGA